MGILIVVIGMVLPVAIIIAQYFKAEVLYKNGDFSVIKDCGEFLIFEKGRTNCLSCKDLELAISTTDSLARIEPYNGEETILDAYGRLREKKEEEVHEVFARHGIKQVIPPQQDANKKWVLKRMSTGVEYQETTI